MKTLSLFTLTMLLGCAAAVQAQEQKTEFTEADRLLIAVQSVCPVTGEELGSMGEPLKVKLGEQDAFLCCKGCLGKQVVAKHWKTVQANLAVAQATCPIMGKPVDPTMKSTVVNGRQIFVCCPPCIEKIQADVEESLKKVNASYVSFVAAEAQKKSDQIHITAQGICPVTGKDLGSMGDPIKVQVGEKEHAFLCCKGCVSKTISARNWKTIQANLANAQGTCPVMGKPVDADMKSTVVNGRKIFVCCPPCIEKIEAEPTLFITKLDSQITANNEK